MGSACVGCDQLLAKSLAQGFQRISWPLWRTLCSELGSALDSVAVKSRQLLEAAISLGPHLDEMQIMGGRLLQ